MESRPVALGSLLASAASVAACATPAPPAVADRQPPREVRTARTQDEMICWVTAVRPDPAGVRIHFNRAGGPLFVGHPGGHWSPDRASPAAQSPAGPFLVARPGDRLSPANSHHDHCELAVVRRDGRLGVLATARLDLPGMEPSTAAAFMPAAD